MISHKIVDDKHKSALPQTCMESISKLIKFIPDTYGIIEKCILPDSDRTLKDIDIHHTRITENLPILMDQYLTLNASLCEAVKETDSWI